MAKPKATPPAQKTHLLIDGDIVAFVCAAACQHTYTDEAGWIMPISNKVEGEAMVENMLHAIKAGLNGDTYEVILTCSEHNWRWDVEPTYKTNRVGVRPQLLTYLKDYLRQNHGAKHWPGLEADDVLAYKMTEPQCVAPCSCGAVSGTEECSGRRLICVGRDKDFKTIPGLHHAWKQDVDAKGKMLVREVSQWEADRFHMIQTLAGDRVDGFDGCPGMGMVRAAQIIDNPVLLIPQEGVKTRGVNKGEAVTKWVAEPTMDYWACIVSHYKKAGLGEREALITARLARLLRYGEYDPDTEELTLWTPDMLRSVSGR